MTSSLRKRTCLCAAVLLMGAVHAAAAPFTASYTDGASWNTLYGQGFNAFVNDGLSEPLEFGDPVPLSRFEFFKSGNADTATDIQLAIIADIYANLNGLTTSSAAFIGVSTNTIASTAGIATGAAIRFDFDELQLNFGDYYGAVFVNIDELGNVTPVLVSALHADFVEVDDGNPETTNIFVPESNYDFNNIASPEEYLNPELQIDYFTSTSNFRQPENPDFLFGFSYGADANFVAYFDYEFPPGTPGDFDEDGDVDGRDFLQWQRGESPTPFSAGDLTDWQTNYGASGLAAVTAVPEPGSLMLVGAASLVLLSRRS
jgi:hypothetical protein